MASNTPSLNRLKDLLYSLSVSNLMINDFGFGPTYNIDAGANKRYPLLWVEPEEASAQRGGPGAGTINVFTYTFNLYVMDKIKKGDLNFDDALSDCCTILQQIVTQIDQHPIYTEMVLNTIGDIVWQPVFEVEDDNLNGWMATITFKVPNRFTPCNIPMLPTLVFTSSLGPNSVEYRLIGPQGVTGPQGYQGVEGPTGSQGLQGDAGPIGTQGIQGPQGTIGVQGMIGPEGVQGITGPQGVQGETGLQGVQGFQGIQGPQGIQGITGPQGFQGTIGIQGVQGFQGVTGPQGIQGSFGPIGPAGLIWRGLWSAAATYSINDSVGYASASWFCYTASAPLGWVGPTSTPPNLDNSHWALLAAQGAQGQQGSQGVQGTFGIGITGPQGSQGAIGSTGANGMLGNTASASISATIENFGETITAGSKGYVRVPYNATINSWSMAADQAGNINIDVRRNSNSLVGGGNKPQLNSGQFGLTAISGWSFSTISNGDLLEWAVGSASNITRVNVSILLTRTS